MATAKAVYLLGGPSKGTRMRPLTLDIPKPLFPLAGRAIIWHGIQALSKVSNLKEVLLIGFYEDSILNPFIKQASRDFPSLQIRYLREYEALGTAGGLYHFRDAILKGSPEQIYVLHSDIASSFPLSELKSFHDRHRGVGTLMGVQVSKELSTKFGCIVTNPETAQALHYVEKPESFLSNTINTGVYLFDKSIFDEIKAAMDLKMKQHADDPLKPQDDQLRLEQDVIAPLADRGKLYVYETKSHWKQIKSAGKVHQKNMKVIIPSRILSTLTTIAAVVMIILSFLSQLSSSSSSSSSAQQNQHQISFSVPRTQSVTLIDLLSNSTDHSKLLSLIQRARLVPTINLLKNSTLLAPTNDAIDRYLKSHPLSILKQPLSSPIESESDNLMTELRQTILYHLLNQSFSSGNFSSKSPQPFETLLFPTTQPSSSLQSPSLFDYHQNHPTAPPLELLGNHSQRLYFLSHDGNIYAGANSSGQGGAKLSPEDKFQRADNGVLIPINNVLIPPPSISQIIQSDPRLSIFRSILPTRFLEYLNSMPHLTLFAPDDEAWKALGSIEMDYLESNFSYDDSIMLFQKFTSQNVLGDDEIGYSDRIYEELTSGPGRTVQVKTIDGQILPVELGSKSNHLIINGSETLQQDILASNGVLHIVPQLLLPLGDNPLSMNAEKYLVTLNCSKFVSLFRSANLSSTYLTNSGHDQASYTILAPRDEALEYFEETTNLYKANDTTESLHKLLTYHIISGKYFPDQLQDGMLLSTELLLKGHSDLKQRMPVSVSETDGGIKGSKKNQSSIIGFGGANVLGVKPIEIGNTMIYIVSQIIEPPSDLLRVALSDIRLSTCVASIFSVKLEEQLQSLRAITFLVPTNKAFAQLGLIMDYLLLEKSKDDLIKVLKYHTLTELIYLRDLKIGHNRRYPTLEGTEIYLNKLGSGLQNVTIHGPSLSGIPLNGETRDSEVVNKKDLLIENGSMELIDQVELPSDVEIDVRKLMLGAKASTMLELIQTSNLSWVLDPQTSGLKNYSGRIETRDRSKDLARSYSILCPTDEAFTKINLTYYMEDQIRLQELILQHVIPTDPKSLYSNDRDKEKPEPFQPLYIGDGKVYSTLLSTREGGPSRYGDVTFRLIDSKKQSSNFFQSNGGSGGDDNDDGGNGSDKENPRWIVGIKGARGTSKDIPKHYSAKVINYGRASPRLISSDETGKIITLGGGVLSLDEVLEPYRPNYWNLWGKLILDWMIVIGFIGLFGFFGRKYYIRQKRRNLISDVNGYQAVEPMEE